MTNKFKFGDKVSYGSCKNAFYLRKTDDIRSLIAVEKFGAIKGGVITVITNELTPATDWVKCSERMPEINVPVLVHTGNGMDIDHTYDFGDGVSFYDDLYGEFTHWMPLPAPPVEVER